LGHDGHRGRGHEDAVQDGLSGLLVDDVGGMVAGLDAVLSDEVLRKRLGIGAQEHAAQYTWDATAARALAALAVEAIARQDPGGR
jgi:glycosyltransferase involved in cell wall biosynthesis